MRTYLKKYAKSVSLLQIIGGISNEIPNTLLDGEILMTHNSDVKQINATLGERGVVSSKKYGSTQFRKEGIIKTYRSFIRQEIKQFNNLSEI